MKWYGTIGITGLVSVMVLNFLTGCGSVVVGPPVPVTDVPVADAGFDLAGLVGDTVILDGSGSYDPNGLPLAYSWVQTSGPFVVLDTPFDPTAAFFADVPGTYVFELTVDNGIYASTDSVVIDIFE